MPKRYYKPLVKKNAFDYYFLIIYSMTMVSKSKSQTQKLASKLAKQILETPAAHSEPRLRREPRRRIAATVIALQGELGAGKTAFTQGFCKALGVKHGVSSPTFIIMRKHEVSSIRHQVSGSKKWIYHFDLYRLRKPKEILALGFKKIIGNPENIVLIEWPELMKKLLPKNTVWINFKHLKKSNQRKITLSWPRGKF